MHIGVLFVMIDMYEDHQTIRKQLIFDGWKTPNTYCNAYQDLRDIPAVYLFLLVEKPFYERCLIGYVGMSTRLKQRIQKHSIKRELDKTPYFVITCFARTTKDRLRQIETQLIQSLDPPWNISGRKRGLAL